MGYDLNGTSHGMRISGAPAVLTMYAWYLCFWPRSTSGTQWLFGEQNANGTLTRGLWLNRDGAGKVSFSKDSTISSDAPAVSVGTVNLNQWNRIYWSDNVYDSSAENQVSLNGEALQTGNSVTTGTLVTTRLGSNAGTLGSRFNYFDGHVGELAMWNDVIDQVGTGAWASLVHGYSPLRVDRQYLAHYWPFRKGVRDVVGGRELVLENGLALGSYHPPMFPAGKMRAA